MTRLRQALDSLRAEPAIIRHSPFARQVDAVAYCPALFEVRDKLRAELSAIKPSSPPLNPANVWQRFEASGCDLNALNNLEVRTLCAADDFATRRSFVYALRSHPDRLKNGRCLYAMVNSYFACWREIEAADELEPVLKAAISEYPRKSPAVERWRGAPSLFSEKAADSLSTFIAQKRANTSRVLKLQFVGAGTRLAVLTHARAAETVAAQFRAEESGQDSKANLESLEWILRDILQDPIFPSAFYSAVSTLILSRSAESSEPFQVRLRNYVQDHARLGDPRLRQNKPKWREAEPEAEQRFLSWIARESIQFFFNTLLPPSDENRRRADFWLRYHKRITDFQVAISEQDRWKVLANKSTSSLPLHSRVTQGTTSAFLMQFKGQLSDFIVVEFSVTGNAAYIYDRDTFESTNVTLRNSQFQLNGHLKHQGWPHRILHSGGWESGAARELAIRGIRP